MCEKVQSFIDKAPGGESGNDVEAGTGFDALQNDFKKLVMNKVKDKVLAGAAPAGARPLMGVSRILGGPG